MFISKKKFTKIIELGKSLWKALRTEKVSFRKAFKNIPLTRFC